MSNDTRNPLGYLHDWQPYRKGQIMLAQVQHILEEYAEYLPLTCRQIYYRMIGEFGHPKGKQFQGSLYDLLVNARRAQIIPFEHIRDDGIMGCGGVWYESAEQKWYSVEASLRSYERNLQQNQPQRMEVWCESAGMVPQLRRVTHDYSIPVYSCGGFNSLTAIRQIVLDCIDTEQDTVVLHLGDYDPSGMSIFERVRDDVTAFLDDDDPGASFEAVRVALVGEYLDYDGRQPTPEGLDQVAEHGLPMDPITTNDARSKAWRRQGRTEKCELEALAPDVVATLLGEAIEERLDHDELEETKRLQERDRSGLWCLRGVPDLEIPLGPDFTNGRRQLGDFARRTLSEIDFGTTA